MLLHNNTKHNIYVPSFELGESPSLIIRTTKIHINSLISEQRILLAIIKNEIRCDISINN